jgi:hypothetical protein
MKRAAQRSSAGSSSIISISNSTMRASPARLCLRRKSVTMVRKSWCGCRLRADARGD